ncbi:hypothetical protein [Paenibacillus sp. NPDC058071]|uniref:hypothetical protein n=1 Tax=Paenibacillus sp. NPDC058071 TaxID=3346326 RepID=UPI0036DDE52A
MIKKYIGLLFIMLTLVGCTSKNDILENVSQEIKNYGISAEVPQVDDLAVNFVYVLPSPTATGDVNTVVISYTERKGELLKPNSNQNESKKKVLYGPFEGDSIFNLSISNVENSLDNASSTTVADLKMEYTVTNDRLILLANQNHMSYMIEGQITSKYTEESYFDVMAGIVHSVHVNTR